jgi:hypothetical protein
LAAVGPGHPGVAKILAPEMSCEQKRNMRLTHAE